MGVGESLRKAAGYFGSGGHEDYGEYDRYDHEDDQPRELDRSHTLVLVRPRSRDFFLAVPHVFDDVQGIANHLKSDVSVLVDLHECDAALVERVVDFCGGLVYALEAGLFRVGERLLLLSPKSVTLSTELGPDTFRHSVFADS